MSFVSFSFAVLFLLVFVGRLTIERKGARTPYLALLLAASLVFYGSFVPAYLLLLFFTTGVDFWAGGRIAVSPTPQGKKGYLVLSLAANLGLLAFFKYANFFMDLSAQLGQMLGWGGTPPKHMDWVLPIGISFFTFESMSYTIDIYWGRLKPVKDYWKFLLFVSFFTHLVSGPIVRARELLYQFERKRKARIRVLLEGSYRMVMGFFFKMVVADNLASFVDPNWVFGAKYQASIVPLYLAFLFSCQIFADFYGYTQIALGSAYILGFKLPDNFNAPYIAGSFREFWTRWHITLSRWIRDYLYIPLGGNKGSWIRAFLVLNLTMMLAGLWHGAALTFVLWGILHGLALSLERLAGFSKERTRPLWMRAFWALFVQGVVLVGWILFRSTDLEQALGFLKNLFAGGFNPLYVRPLFSAAIFTLPVLGLHLGAFLTERGWMVPADGRAKAILSALMFYGVLTLYGNHNAFIYYQF